MSLKSNQVFPQALNKFKVVIAGIALAAAAASAAAPPVQLVVNGEFETLINASVASNNWTTVVNGSLPGWTGSSGRLEIWGENFINTAPGTDGQAHGKNLELTHLSPSEYVTQSVSIEKAGSVDFSFDAWRRSGTGVLWSITGTNGLNSGGTLNLADNNWHALPTTHFDVTANDVLTLRFQSIGGGSMGSHIDQVSMLFTEQANNVSEPASLGLLFAGLGMVGFVARRRKQQ